MFDVNHPYRIKHPYHQYVINIVQSVALGGGDGAKQTPADGLLPDSTFQGI